MDRSALFPIQHPSLRRRLEELIGAVDGAAWDTPHAQYKRALGHVGQCLGRIADQTHTDQALEQPLGRYLLACTLAGAVTEQEGSPLAALYEWLSWYLEALLLGTWAEDAAALAGADAVLTLLAQP